MSASKQSTFTIDKIRQGWLQYFKDQNHLVVPSASLIPAGDPTLLFTTAGMVPFKNYFSGASTPPSSRIVSIQKCIRTTDLEEVGKTDRHCTFFEMMGNFSFGDYFKTKAIQYSWDFSLNILGLNPDKIYVTVFEDDDEAVEIWTRTIGVPASKITKLGKKDNWWGPAGASGACGPCSELYLDRGKNHCSCKKPASCHPGNECDRFMEYWNLVFNQYNQDVSGKLHPLPQTGIDTGAGLERLAALLGGYDSVYDTDEMIQIIHKLELLTASLRKDKQKIKYDKNKNPAPFRVITDHVRSAVFAIADGIYPDKTGRGYVIRRIIRRALLFSRELGIFEPVLGKLVPLVVDIYKSRYPELKKLEKEIQNKVQIEEERFLHTLEQGLDRWAVYSDAHKKSDAKNFSGKDAFTLYDTFGFPLEMTRELAQKEGWQINQKEFDQCMSDQQKRSAAASNWKDIELPADFGLDSNQATGFHGYENSSCEAKVLAILDSNFQIVKHLETNQEGILVLDSTVFYPEGGGQLGDTGIIKIQDSIFNVSDTRKKADWILHIGTLQNGKIKVNDEVTAEINQSNRYQLEQHHSATHLLNRALRDELGNHIKQTGSLVSPTYLRFDFSHNEAIVEKKLELIESRVHKIIEKNTPVAIQTMPIKDATNKGAMATFGEKYSDMVRVVSFGENGEDSMELCGGCHVNNAGKIGLFHIIRESSPGAGNRRIEAVAGDLVVDYFQKQMDQINTLADEHNTQLQSFDPADIQLLKLDNLLPLKSSKEILQYPSDAISLKQQIERSRKKIQDAKKKLTKLKNKKNKNKSSQLLDNIDSYINSAVSIGELKVIKIKLNDSDLQTIRGLADKIKEKLRGVVILAALNNQKPVLMFTADKQALDYGVNCSELIKQTASLIGGSGGGKPDMAQAGGNDSGQIDAALEKALGSLQKNE